MRLWTLSSGALKVCSFLSQYSTFSPSGVETTNVVDQTAAILPATESEDTGQLTPDNVVQ